MNEPTLPPILPVDSLRPPVPLPLGDGPGEKEPIGKATEAVEAMLRQPRRLIYQLRQGDGARLIARMAALGLVCALIYGVVIGTFSGGTQLWAAPLKLALGLLGAGLICLPSLYIFSCLAGSPARITELAGLVAGLVLLLTLLLIGFAPVAWVFSQSTHSVVMMGVLHLGFGFVALIFGMRFLAQGFRWLGTPFNSGLRVWLIIFALVLLQMTTALRPIIGTADTLLPAEKKFFLTHWMEQMTGRTNLTQLVED